MPSHLANWMKEEKRKIKERNKRIDKLIQSGELGHTINYQLMESEDMKGKKKEDKKMPKKPGKKC